MRRYGAMSKAVLTLLLAIGLAVPAPGGAGIVSAAGSAANAVVDGKPVAFAEAAPVIQAGRMLVPARALLEAMGARMAWDPDARIVTATLQAAQGGGTALLLKIGSPYVQRTVTDATGKASVYVVKLDVAAQLAVGQHDDPAAGERGADRTCARMAAGDEDRRHLAARRGRSAGDDV
ncbi:copper amine oxidase N-terminal domain-containing protein [Cohnella rhizosphaerae]|uniref:Copper amine oxidase N-terminal domain-containing protein n=1 Tax=Cohnella rhizosphaerae TaxID=1457232 RepID=A0A9X4QS84_9BACL|nr:copper amine oxidase N-terminal domain-containing protein [Cohnella rhizosphaerae]MDG0809335.1 copper amine oxidase N-terminal domain-containing protein [Cohnella rhizosphaerae]